jgi:glycine dehydrogenase subunit 1
VDPISLGILSPPGSYGADIICGDLQSLGIHMLAGGGQSGFIAFGMKKSTSPNVPWKSTASWIPSRRASSPSPKYGRKGPPTGSGTRARTGSGTASGLWTIGAAVYLSLMGPAGMREIGEVILKKAAYTRNLLLTLPGVKPVFSQTNFKEFLVDFSGTGKTVAQINQGLKEKKIFGGKDVSAEFSGLGQCALYCVTEIHTEDDIQRLYHALQEVLK